MKDCNRHTLLQGPWNNWPLQRIFPAITAVVLVFFVLVLALGIRQYLLYNQCRQAVAAGDRLLFQFTTIKDHLNESLVLAEEVNLRSLSDELQLLEKEVSQLNEDILVPEGIKAMLPSRVNLIGLEVQLRAVQEHPPDKDRESLALVRALSGVNTGLQQFRFGLGDHTQRVLLGLHKIIAGALGLIVVLSCTLLYLLNRWLTVPILDICRLPGLDDGDHCSLHRLHQQIVRLQDLAATAQQPVAAIEPGDLIRQAHRFRCTVLGVVGAELASELTNRLNGILNYTQTLIDVEGKKEGVQLRADILPLLVHEEQKAAELVGIVQRVGQWQPARPSSISLPQLFTQLNQLLEKTLRAESISLELPHDNRSEALVPAGDLWLVLLTLIDQGRRALNQGSDADRPAKLIRITAEANGQSSVCFLQLSNSAGVWLDDGRSLWPDRCFCRELLHLHRAELHEQLTGLQLQLRLELPCRSSVA